MKKIRLSLLLALLIILAGAGMILLREYFIPGIQSESDTPNDLSAEAAPLSPVDPGGSRTLEKTTRKIDNPPEKSKTDEKNTTFSSKERVYSYWVEKGLVLADREDYTGALRSLNKAIDIMPERKEAREIAADLNCMLARMSYEKSDLPRAEELFKEVIYYMPDETCGLLGLGLCAYRKDVDLEKARTWLESYIRQGGEEAIAYGTLGEIHYRENDLETASLYLERALTRAPGDQDVGRLLQRIQRERRVEKNFSTDDTRHFVVKFEGYEQSAVSGIILVLLEEARIVVGQTLDYNPSIPITAILYSNEQFQDVTQSPAWANAIFDGKIRIPTKGLKEKTKVLERIIFHEYTHALVFEYTRGNRVPVWFQEGLAQNSEGEVSEENEMIFEVFAKSDKIIPLQYLETSFLGLSPFDAKIAYAESLAAVKYIKTRYGNYALRALLEELADGENMEQAIRSVFHISYEEFDKRFLEWLKNHYSQE